MLRGAHLFISGGAGFIGTALVSRLVADNRITVFDNLHRNTLVHTDLVRHSNLQLIPGDVRDRRAVALAMNGATHVVHLAAIAGVNAVVSSPLATMEVTLKGSWNILEAALQQPDLCRFVDISTSEVFGVNADRVAETDATPVGPVGEPRWAYAVSKLAAEHLCHMAHHDEGLKVVSLRPFNVFGPGQLGEGAVHRFIADALCGGPLRVHNDGSQIRAWCYIDDFIDALLCALIRPAAVGQTFHIGHPGNSVTVLELARRIADRVNPGLAIIHEPKGGVDVDFRIPDITAAQQVLGFVPSIHLDEGLRRTIDWYRESGHTHQACVESAMHNMGPTRSLPL